MDRAPARASGRRARVNSAMCSRCNWVHLGATVMFSHPEAVRTIFRAPPESFECQHFNESYRFVMGDHALFLQDGERHRQIKRVMAPPLCHEGMEGQARDDPRRSPARRSTAGRVDRSLAVRPLMHELALRVLMKMVFGARESRRRAGRGLVQVGSLARSASVEALGEPESPPTPASRPDLQRARIPSRRPRARPRARPARLPAGVPIRRRPAAERGRDPGSDPDPDDHGRRSGGLRPHLAARVGRRDRRRCSRPCATSWPRWATIPTRCTVAIALLDGDLSGDPADSPDLADGLGEAADGAHGDPGIPARRRGSTSHPAPTWCIGARSCTPSRWPFARSASWRGDSVRTSTSRSAAAIAIAWARRLAPMEMKLVLATILSRGRIVLDDAGGRRRAVRDPGGSAGRISGSASSRTD